MGFDREAALDKLRSFRHFIQHAYDCELDDKELTKLHSLFDDQVPVLLQDLEGFRDFIQALK